MKFALVSLLALPLVAEAFAFAPSTPSASFTQLNMKKESNGNVNVNDILKPFGTIAIAASIALSPISASAQDQDTPFLSSSIQLSESVKLLDMGLPSYGDISNPKATQTSIQGVTPSADNSDSGSSIGLPTKKSGGGNALYAAKKAKPEPKKKVVIEKTAEEKEADDKKPLDTVRFNDMSMPSYSDTASGPRKSKFAL